MTIDRSLTATQRVSIDGTDPSLNLSFLDGHPVAQAIWLYGDSPNRGFNYSLLAPEILGKLEIYKSSEARLPEGSIGGTILMHTVQPLDTPANAFRGTIGYNFNDMASKGKPDVSVFYSWKNPAQTFGVDVSAQHYEQVTDREGAEVFGYHPVSDYAAVNPAIAAEVAAGTIKSTDMVPDEFNAAYFQQTEKRDSVTANLQWRPNNHFEAGLGLMYLRDKLDNFNQSMYTFWHWTTGTEMGVTHFNAASGGVVSGGHSCDLSIDATCPGLGAAVFDNNARTATITTKGIDLHGTYRADGWSLHGQAGVSTSHDPLTQAFIEPVYFGGYTWDINRGFNFDNPAAATNPANWAGYYFNGNYAKQPYAARDNYAQLDFTKDFDSFINDLRLGVRWADHHENQILDVWTGSVQGGSLAQVGAGSLTDLSGLADLGGLPGAVHHVQPINGDTVSNWVLGSPGLFDPQYLYAPYIYEDTFDIDQKSYAGYAQLDFGNEVVHGNVGLRVVHTLIDASGFVVSGSQISTLPPPPGSYQTIGNSHVNYLPSFNIAWNISPDVVLRGAVSQVIAWAPYNQETPYTITNDSVLTATGGNPHLDPYKSNNFNLSAEWYFAPQSILAASVFYKDLQNYIVQGVGTERLYNSLFTTSPNIYAGLSGGDCDNTGYCNYSITRPANGGKAKVKGFTLSYQQPFGDSGFGLRANYTYADGSTASGGALPYNSKNAFNVAPYYEKGPFTSSINYGWRSSYLAGGYVAGAPSETIGSYKELDFNATWRFTPNFSLSLDALNLLNSTYFGYLGTENMPVARYKQGREYVAKLRFKF